MIKQVIFAVTLISLFYFAHATTNITNFSTFSNISTFNNVGYYQKPIRKPTLDCSAQLAAYNLTQKKLTDAHYLDPVLHDCIRAHPYNTLQLPLRVGQIREPIRMEYNFFFTNLLLFESDGTVGFKAFLRFDWEDVNRVWNRSQIPPKKIRLHYMEIWTPLFSLANCETEVCHIIPHNKTNVHLDYDGTVTYVIQIRQLATCVMNLKAFPYDVERCQFLFYLIDYKNTEIVISNTKTQLEYFRFHSEEWKLESISDLPINYTMTRYNRSEKNYSVWNYQKKMLIKSGTTGFVVELCFTRHVGYYLYNLIAPVLIIVAIGFFTVFLPPFSGDKINLAVTVLLGFLFVQEIIAELMPKSESIPYLAVYVVYALLVSTFNVAACACIVAIYNLPTDRKPPLFVRILLVRIIGGVLYGSYAFVWHTLCLFHHISRGIRHLRARRLNKRNRLPRTVMETRNTQSARLSEERSLMLINSQVNSHQFINGLSVNCPATATNHPVFSESDFSLSHSLSFQLHPSASTPSNGVCRTDAKVQTLALSDAQKKPEEEYSHPISKYIGLSAESWQDVARVMNMLNSFTYIGASIWIFYGYFLPILPFSKINFDINGKCPE